MRGAHLVWTLLGAAALSAPAPAAAAARAITGKLNKRGYTVIAVAYSGKTSSTRSRSSRLVPRASRVTLQLRGPKGRYAGPVVVGGTAKPGVPLGTGYSTTDPQLTPTGDGLQHTAGDAPAGDNSGQQVYFRLA